MSLVKFFSSLIGGSFYRSNIYDNRSALLGSGFPVRNYGAGGFYGGPSGYPGLLYNQQSVEQYLAIMDMLSELFMFSVTGLAVRYISEAVLESMKDSISITISHEDEKLVVKATDFLYKYFDRIDYKNLIYRILPEFIYYGNYAFALDEEYNLLHLYDPYCVISLLGKNHKEIGYILNTPDGMGFTYKEDSGIFRIGNLDIMLYSRFYDIKIEDQEDIVSVSRRAKNFSNFYQNSSLLKNNKGWIRDYVFAASLPLFYYSRVKLREYVMKDLILMLTTIRDLLFPTVLTLNHEYFGTSSGFQVVNLVDQIENILNSYVDLGGFIGVKADLTRILNTLTYSIRVLPDYKGVISNLQGLDTNKLLEKLDRYKGDLTELLENVLSDIGIPLEAFTSKSTYWESLRQSERFSSKVNSVVMTIENSFRMLAEEYLSKNLKEFRGHKNFLSIKIFDNTMGRISKSINALENISSYVNGVLEFIEGTFDKYENENYNHDVLTNFIKTNLSYVVSDVDTLVKWEDLKKKAEESMSEDEGGDDMGEDDFGEEEEQDFFMREGADIGEKQEETEEETGGGEETTEEIEETGEE